RFGSRDARLFPDLALSLENRPFYRDGWSPKTWSTRFEAFLGPTRTLWSATARQWGVGAGVGRDFGRLSLGFGTGLLMIEHLSLPGGRRDDRVWEHRAELRYALAPGWSASLPVAWKHWTFLDADTPDAAL